MMRKILFVAGASSDMGMAMIKEFKDSYDCIVAHYLHMNSCLLELSEELGEKMLCIQADLADGKQVGRMIAQARERGIVPTHFVHFPAPLCQNGRFHKIKWEVFQNEIDVSLKSLITILQAFLPQMAKNHFGRVVVMLSFVTEGMPPGYCSNYVVTKYAMLGLVRALASEYAAKGITVNGISPAWVNTKFIRNQPDILIQRKAAASPAGRLLEVADVLPAIRYLLGEDSGAINGQNIIVSGGM